MIFFKWFSFFFKGVFDSFLNLSFFVYVKKLKLLILISLRVVKNCFFYIYFHPDGV